MKITAIPEYYMVNGKPYKDDYSNTAIISIMSTDVDRLVDLKPFKASLKLDFDDLDLWHLKDDCKYINELTPFNKQMARQIWEFVLNLDKDIDELIVHCEAGISRSPAVAYAIYLICNNKDSDIRPSCPNKLVLSLMLDAYRELAEELGYEYMIENLFFGSDKLDDIFSKKPKG